MLFIEIDNFIEVYNNSVIELRVFGPRSLVGLITSQHAQARWSNSDQRTCSQNTVFVQLTMNMINVLLNNYCLNQGAQSVDGGDNLWSRVDAGHTQW